MLLWYLFTSNIKNIYHFLSHVFSSLGNVRNRRSLTYEWPSNMQQALKMYV